MPKHSLADAVRRAVQPWDDAGQTDGQLLAHFVRRRDHAAFAALVRRHGAMVWGVCRRRLHDRQDAEDAFQAAFLVLALKAASVVPGERVGAWLHGVARQTAVRAGAAAARRREKETPMRNLPEPPAHPDGVWDEVLPHLDREVERLPDKYRLVVVLCDLEGKTRREAARQLGWPEGTVAGRLARARALLARRLKGYDPQGASVPPPPAGLVNATAAVVGGCGAVPASVAALAKGVVMTMKTFKLAALGGVLLAVAAVAGGSAVVACRAEGPGPQPIRATAAADGTSSDAAWARADVQKEDETAWGEPSGGLRAGLYIKGGRRTFHVGEVVPLMVRLRNVTDKPIAFSYYANFFKEFPPAVTDADGKPARLSTFPNSSNYYYPLPVPRHLSLAAGQTVEFGSLDLALAPANAKDDPGKALFASPGVYRVRYESLPPYQGGDAAKVFATGKLELEVKGDLEGSWQAVSFMQDGRTPRGVDVKDIVATFEDGKYLFTTGLRAQGAGKGALAVHPDADPKTFELTPDSGVYEGKAFRGIYCVEGDRLTLCFSWPVKDRPAEFASPPDSTVVLAVFDRRKP